MSGDSLFVIPAITVVTFSSEKDVVLNNMRTLFAVWTTVVTFSVALSPRVISLGQIGHCLQLSAIVLYHVMLDICTGC